jgi:hypothetical protein
MWDDFYNKIYYENKIKKLKIKAHKKYNRNKFEIRKAIKKIYGQFN